MKYIAMALFMFLMLFSSTLGQFKVIKENGGYLIRESDKNVAFYQQDLIGPNNDLLRNNFWHPVYLPDGTVITENAPEDHLHQRGIFWAWHKILRNGKSLGDGWDLKDYRTPTDSFSYEYGKDGKLITHTSVVWLSPLYKAAKVPYLDEKSRVIFHPVQDNYRMIDFKIELMALVDGLQIAGSDDVKGYGGFSTRIKLPDDVTFISSNGQVEPRNEAVEAGSFMNISGAFAKKGTRKGGLVIIADPDNQSVPQKWILRNKESMQNPVFPGRDPYELEKGKPLLLNYRIILYVGELDQSLIDGSKY